MSLEGSSPGGEKKYELVLDQQIVVAGATLYRIRALKDFGNVKAGALGGFVAMIYGHAQVRDHGLVFGRARLGGQVRVLGDGQVCGDAQLDGRTVIGGDEKGRRPFPDVPPRSRRPRRPPSPRAPRP